MTWAALDRAPDWEGVAGRAWDVFDPMRDWSRAAGVERPEHSASLFAAIVHLPAATVLPGLWTWYMVAAVHLRPIPDSTPPRLQFPAATHEVNAVALDPDAPVEPPLHYLQPVNVAAQFACVDDERIPRVMSLVMAALVAGTLPMEDGGRTLSNYWRSVIETTLEHDVTGGHS